MMISAVREDGSIPCGRQGCYDVLKDVKALAMHLHIHEMQIKYVLLPLLFSPHPIYPFHFSDRGPRQTSQDVHLLYMQRQVRVCARAGHALVRTTPRRNLLEATCARASPSLAVLAAAGTSNSPMGSHPRCV